MEHKALSAKRRLELLYGSSRAGPTDKGYTDATDLTDSTDLFRDRDNAKPNEPR